ncbi:MAG: DUF4838 domain-containing protein [Phycisphaerae bacterium]|jgi:hypothetical protein
MLLATPAPLSAGVVLVQDGRPAATIVTAEKPSVNATEAAAELAEYLERISGARLPVATDSAAPPSGPLVLVGRSRLTDAIAGLVIPAGRTRNFQEEGFVIRTVGDRLVLAGNDDEGYLGTRYAVADFLNRLGVRWFMPGRIGEVVPRMATIEIGDLDVLERPDFALRDFWEHARGRMDREGREWKIHHKLNPGAARVFGVPSDGSVQNYLPRNQFDAHPDWFALQADGTRAKDHPCTTSEGMIQHFIERIKAEARQGRKVTAFAPVDGNPRCWCKGCERIGNGFDGFGANDRDPVPESSASNEWFYFVNRILTEVNREFPDHVIATNGYANRDIPPEMPPDVAFNPDRNLTVMFANIGACTIHSYDDPRCWQMRRQGQMIRQWCRLSDKVWIYNYNYTMLINKGTITPMVHRVRKTIPRLKEWGVIGFFDQDEADWAMSGIPTRIVRAALQWNTRADVDAILDDFYGQWFGAAGPAMKRYYDALAAAFERAPQHGHEDVILPVIYGEALMAELDAAMREAEAAAPAGSVKERLGIERLIYDHLCAYVALEKAKRACDFPAAVECAARMDRMQQRMTAITPFMGWHPYPACDVKWELKRMQRLAARTGGPEGDLVAVLPEEAAFRTDPFDDGRYERWQDSPASGPPWRPIRTTAGWDAQGLHDAAGHPYKGIAWYQFEVRIPAGAEGKTVFLHGPAVAAESWAWVNGRYAGHVPFKMVWFRPHTLDLDVSRLIRPGEVNRITLRVLCNIDVWGAMGVYERMFLYARRPPEGATRPRDGSGPDRPANER